MSDTSSAEHPAEKSAEKPADQPAPKSAAKKKTTEEETENAPVADPFHVVYNPDEVPEYKDSNGEPLRGVSQDWVR